MKKNVIMLFGRWPLYLLPVVLLLTLSACAATQVSEAGEKKTAPPVETAEGIVLGVQEAATNTFSWKGIPYARPPVNDLRWKAPQPPEVRSEPFTADAFCDLCPQFVDHDRNPATPQITVGNEDCLYLNIWTPRDAEGDLPVFFWIHGGGNSIQWPLLFMLDGGILAEAGNMVVVTVNYRLGPMGFWSHPALRTGDDPASDSGNFAVLDLIQALEWVQSNIKNFGGDAGNVTIVGESAGGENVFSLLSSPMAKGLFHKAIVQSGVVRPSTPEQGEAHVNRIIAKLMVDERSAADMDEAQKIIAAMSDEEIEKYMRMKSPHQFLEMYPEGRTAGMIRFPTSYIDGEVLPMDFYQAVKSDNHNKVPMILGSNKDEVRLFLRSVRPFSDWRADHSLFTDPAKRELYELVSKYQSDGWKVMAVDHPARLMRNITGQPFIYAYQFLWGSDGDVLDAPLDLILGACHAMEIDFVFGTEAASLGSVAFTDRNKPGRVALQQAMMDYWSRFAHTGNPNRADSGLPQWDPWSNIEGFPKSLLLNADLEKAKIVQSRTELTNQDIEDALKEEPRQEEIQPFWDGSPYRIR